ncbi:MAG: hypothetical protein K1X53_01345 [Candidatus Sumerlaeaceae bacterium]|nr:hypothetical protein [Candidatus Sumerlaeaceae bacterium]
MTTFLVFFFFFSGGLRGTPGVFAGVVRGLGAFLAGWLLLRVLFYFRRRRALLSGRYYQRAFELWKSVDPAGPHTEVEFLTEVARFNRALDDISPADYMLPIIHRIEPFREFLENLSAADRESAIRGIAEAINLPDRVSA